MKATSEMPCKYYEVNTDIVLWVQSLQQCEISESLMNDLANYLRDFELGIYSPNPIDITDIVEYDVKCGATRCDNECIKCEHPKATLVFKSPTKYDKK